MREFNTKDMVQVEGMDGIFIVDGYKEELYISLDANNVKNEKYELTYYLEEMKTKKKHKVIWKLVKPLDSVYEKRSELDQLLDTYNNYIELEEIFKDGNYKKKAEDIVRSLKNKRYKK